MNALPNRRAPRPSLGFALIENLISVVLLSIGAIGIAVSTATTIKINVDNLQRSMALNAASSALENLYISAVADPDGTTLRSSLDPFLESGVEVDSNPDSAGADRDTFLVTVTEAVDAAGVDILENAPPYVSPVTVAVRVDYQGVAGRNVTGVDEVKSARASFTFILGS